MTNTLEAFGSPKRRFSVIEEVNKNASCGTIAIFFLRSPNLIVLISILNNSNSYAKNIDDYGVISLMYHRFEENKYPSTNIKIKDFKKHLDLIEQNDFNFISHKEFEDSINSKNLERKILLTIDDGFKSFYENAWPILKQRKIPFIIFINTE